MILLNLGSGNNYRDGYVNIDNSPHVQSDLQLDLSENKLPYEDEEVDSIVAIDLLEHILYPIPLLNECHRVLKKEGTFYIEVPKAGTNDYYKDPTHVRPFVPETFKYFSDYAREYVAIGCKPWKITGMREEPSRLFVTMIKD